ncbi:hypothetical protein EF847_14850 [Actinobacteria bacterium YIM 96077]|uniref:EthD family reductase n=1 Tax=Phytoactinopolyspora halophila TaxID=1981511 RepID=A0A329QTD7_9ACTN|nr:hypothetical protein [Phytoactinopolyspora halophila]AYY13782.1 hypothetical protein EF847_14850 [Actinobacteria bacterium YIM 96077]RAW15674.1 hypothetical protein DPM12_08490 [Phytoactinopolyspora halophila]
MIRLQIFFAVDDDDRDAFEQMYHTVYVPALQRQQGYLGCSLLRRYPADVLDEFGGTPVPYTYQLELDFDTEENRRRWAASDDHEHAWTQASALATSVQSCGYDVVAAEPSVAPHAGPESRT